jgi:hypothetical protein
MMNISYKVGLLRASFGAFLVLGMNTFLLGQISHQNYFSRSDLNITTITAEDRNMYAKVFMLIYSRWMTWANQVCQ